MNNIEKTIQGLAARGIDAKLFENGQQLTEALMAEIPNDALVAFGGSKTLDNLGLYDSLTSRGNKVLWHWRVEKEKVGETLKQALLSDVYLASANAITEDGRIVNIDGTGNRITAMVFGPKKVILVVGRNKICPDMDSAITRIKEVACPQNAERLNRDTPCRYTKKCSDCSSPARMCSFTTVIERKPPTMEFKVYFVNEDMGY